MDEKMQANPDYQLVMRFLSSITPGDMDKEAADQLRMIGQRIQAGGALSDKEREMFQSVVGAMPAMPDEMPPMPMDPNQGVYMPPPQPMSSTLSPSLAEIFSKSLSLIGAIMDSTISILSAHLRPPSSFQYDCMVELLSKLPIYSSFSPVTPKTRLR